VAGETEEKPSRLTVDTLKLLLDARMQEVEKRIDQRFTDADKRYEQRFEAQQKAIVEAQTAAQKGVDAAFAAAKEATSKAELAADKRFEGVNEFRGQLSDQAATFITRVEAEARMIALSEKVSELSSRVNVTSGRAAGELDARGLAVAAVGILIALAAVVVAVIVAVSSS